MVKRLPIDLEKGYITKPLMPETLTKVLAEDNPSVMHRIYLVANELKEFQPFMELEHDRFTVSANISVKYGYAGAAKEQAGLIKMMKSKVNQNPQYIISLTLSEKVNMVERFTFKHTTSNRQEVYDLITKLEEKINELK
jgi:hypothetical protein